MTTPTLSLYTFGSGNGKKAPILLEILKVKYNLRKIDITKGEQAQEWYKKIHPNGQIPAITDVDKNGKEVSIFESAAVLQFLADKYDSEGKVSYKLGDDFYWDQLKWLTFQTSTHSPIQGQLNQILFNKPDDKYAISKGTEATKKIYSVYETRLKENNGWLVGNKLNIADIAAFPVVQKHSVVQISLEEFPNLANWLEKIGNIEGVKEGSQI